MKFLRADVDKNQPTSKVLSPIMFNLGSADSAGAVIIQPQWKLGRFRQCKWTRMPDEGSVFICVHLWFHLSADCFSAELAQAEEQESGIEKRQCYQDQVA